MRVVPTVLLALLAGWCLARLPALPPAGAAPSPDGFADVVARCDPSIGLVTTSLDADRGGRSRDDAVGAAWVVRSDGLLLTSRHVVAGAKQIIVILPGRSPMRAQVVSSDDATDTALLRVPARGLVPLSIGEPRTLRVGQWVLAAGSPYHLANSWSVGIVSGLGRKGVGVNPRGYEDFIQTDAAANLGNSGGPLLDAQGRVVGVMTAILSRAGGSQGVGLALPVDIAMQAVARMGGGAGPARARPTLALHVRPAPGGLVITRFDPGSPAQQAGLAVGDLLRTFDGQPLASVSALQRALWNRSPGETITLGFVRAGQPAQRTVVLAPR